MFCNWLAKSVAEHDVLPCRCGSRSSLASWCSTVCTTKHPSTSSTSASLYPVSPPDNAFALPTEVFSSCLAIVSAVTVGGLFLWPALRYRTGYQIADSMRDPALSRDSFRRSLKTFFIFSLLVESFLDDALYKFTYLLTYLLTYRLTCADHRLLK